MAEAGPADGGPVATVVTAVPGLVKLVEGMGCVMVFPSLPCRPEKRLESPSYSRLRNTEVTFTMFSSGKTSNR